MRGLQLTRRGRVVGMTLLALLAMGLGYATGPYVWDGDGYTNITSED